MPIIHPSNQKPHPAVFPAAMALALALPAVAPAQTTPLNDTGLVQCVSNAGTWTACNTASTGNAATYPGQDGRFGRDAAQAAGALAPPKTGGGAAGFDFSPVALGGGQAALGSHACVYDNVTGLLWSAETLGPMNHAAVMAAGAAYNGASRCGAATGWRLPVRRELLSIVHNGVATPPAIDTAYFPGTQTNTTGYWTSDVYASDTAHARSVSFYDGTANVIDKSSLIYVRLVRSVP